MLIAYAFLVNIEKRQTDIKLMFAYFKAHMHR